MVLELSAVTKAINSKRLINQLQKVDGRGPKGYRAAALFRVFISSYLFGHDSISQTVRSLQENPALLHACGLTSVPSRPTLSRFFSRLSESKDLLTEALADLTDVLSTRLDGFGIHTAVDSSVVSTWSNPNSDSDPDAGWTKKDWNSNKKTSSWHYGYKLHLLVDAEYELPIWCYTTSAKSADSQNLTPLLRAAGARYSWFSPSTVSADKGYDARHIYDSVKQFGARAIIPLKAYSKNARKSRPGSDARLEADRESKWFKRIYSKRSSVERVFGRLKENRRLDTHRMRNLKKVETHALLSVITLQSLAVVQLESGSNLRGCVRRIA